jgi:hypothetical protein
MGGGGVLVLTDLNFPACLCNLIGTSDFPSHMFAGYSPLVSYIICMVGSIPI